MCNICVICVITCLTLYAIAYICIVLCVLVISTRKFLSNIKNMKDLKTGKKNIALNNRPFRKNWPAIITSAISGTGGGVLIGASFWGPVGAILGGVTGSLISAFAEIRNEEKYQNSRY